RCRKCSIRLVQVVVAVAAQLDFLEYPSPLRSPSYRWGRWRNLGFSHLMMVWWELAPNALCGQCKTFRRKSPRLSCAFTRLLRRQTWDKVTRKENCEPALVLPVASTPGRRSPRD